MAVIGALIRHKAGKAWQRTKDRYDHPFALGRALGDFDADSFCAERRLDDQGHIGRVEQADDGNARKFEGSGLGLAIAKKYTLLPKQNLCNAQA